MEEICIVYYFNDHDTPSLDVTYCSHLKYICWILEANTGLLLLKIAMLSPNVATVKRYGNGIELYSVW